VVGTVYHWSDSLIESCPARDVSEVAISIRIFAGDETVRLQSRISMYLH
jgi:hypothetical protein